MRFVHAREYLNAGDVVVVQCSHQCNVRVMGDADFRSFKNNGAHNYHGGHFVKLPARIVVPQNGYWNITVDLGGSPSAFKYGISYLKSAIA
ncbi:MAG TPA: DUF1883 domain-containing protein [Bradyrhizobium sp.]|jgi:hypothetical protein|uniref:DUF1883 domain-containing protein n=1 Tax=Bradyrhizobium sp. TaxID=376 RepID=UPI002B6A7B87|nr:DUF1883 domain-containing protein [Bradyrhizobium sp.]HTB03472.1 DUF1883 domain-containing protein [Bradyrhizobium sp.]